MSNYEIESKIEYQEVIGEANEGCLYSIRFSRIKYKKCNYTHIDIRKFQRGYNKEGEEEYYPTKTGFRITEREFRLVLKDYSHLPEAYLHPKIIDKCSSLLNNGQYESAVFQAFKCIETSIKGKAKVTQDEIGVKLIRIAFHPDNGFLTDFTIPKAERESLSNYIAGAFGYYKNPCSHRDVELDFNTAFDRIAVASDLLKIVENATVNNI